jgi:hypothetical protein
VIDLQQQAIQTPAKTEDVQPISPQVDQAEPAEIDELFADVREELAFWYEINDMIGALVAAGHNNR